MTPDKILFLMMIVLGAGLAWTLLNSAVGTVEFKRRCDWMVKRGRDMEMEIEEEKST